MINPSDRETTGDVIIRHGEENIFRVVVDVPSTVTLYSPNNDVVFVREVPAGDSDVPLGPLLCPPVLRYRSGVIEWQGYRLFHAAGGGTWFSQTRASVPRFWKFHESTRRPSISRWVRGDLHWQPFRLETAFSMPLSIRLSDEALVQRWEDVRLIIADESSGERSPQFSFFVILRDADGGVLHRSEEILASAVMESLRYDFLAESLAVGAYSVSLEILFEGQIYRDAPEIRFRKFEKDGTPRWPRSGVVSGSGGPHIDLAELNRALSEDQSAGGDPLTRMKCWADTRRTIAVEVTLENAAELYLKTDGCGCALSISHAEPRIFLPAERCFAGLLPAGPSVLTFHSLFSLGDQRSRVAEVSFESVVRHAKSKAATGALPLVGINDWTQYFADNSLPQLSQVKTIIERQREMGFSEIGWSIGRSWLEYWSDLPGTSRWPVVPLEIAVQRDPRAHKYVGQTAVVEEGCPLREAVKRAQAERVLLTAWMGLNSHYYAEAIGGICCSKWFQANPRLHQWRKNAPQPFPGELCFYFPEVRQERVAILCDVAAIGVDRFLLDGTRQPRVALYHPEMTGEYLRLTGVDPGRIDIHSGVAYREWIQWRSQFFTRFLREVRAEFAVRFPGKRMHLSMRIPQCSVEMNLASGFDVMTWFQEGLIDRLYLNPLEIYGGGLREVTPYVDAGHAAGVEIFGAIGQTWLWNDASGVAAALLRADSLISAGVDGLDFYESELLAKEHPLHELVRSFQDPQAIKEWLSNSNLLACHPLGNENAACGYDNHSRWDGKGWTCEGFLENSL